MMETDRRRRAFLKIAGAAAALTTWSRLYSNSSARAAGPPGSPSNPSAPSHGNDPPRGPIGGGPSPDEFKVPEGHPMPTRTLGRTGVALSLLGIGGYHLGIPERSEAIRIVREAIDHGVTFLDNCWDYNGGDSEKRMGEALQDGYRRRAFVMTKLDGRTAAAATDQLEQSLRRLRTDAIDLVQIHEVIRPTDPDRVFAPGGAIEALINAREAGKLRFIGFTGHKSPDIHLSMLDTAARHGFRFDTVQMPLNVMDAHYDSFEARVLPRLVKEHIGVLGMKPMGSGVILESGVVSAVECLRYAMSLPTSVVITGCDSLGVLRQALSTAITFAPMGERERQALLARTTVAARAGEYEQYKTSGRFDGTAQNPRWLESAHID
jgi:aryl-alcohol dehydrogenase-like predicted oxidoreductase